MQRSKKQELAYMAGFIDGEGCFSIAQNGAIDVRAVNTNPLVLKFIAQHLGGTVTARKQKVNKTQYVWTIYGEGAVVAMQKLLPFLRDKKEQAKFIIKYFSDRPKMLRGGSRGSQRNPLVTAAIQTVRDLKKVDYLVTGELA